MADDLLPAHERESLRLVLPLPERPLVHFTLVEPELPADVTVWQVMVRCEAIHRPHAHRQLLGDDGRRDQILDAATFARVCDVASRCYVVRDRYDALCLELRGLLAGEEVTAGH